MRAIVAAAVGLWLFPVLAVGAVGLGLATFVAAAIGLAAAAPLAWLVSGPIARTLAPGLAAYRWFGILVGLAAAAAIAQTGRLSVFMADVSRPAFSIAPADPFRTAHSCATGYAEAARFAAAGADNIYDAAMYLPRYIGPIKVDAYHYPPTFLLAPAAVRAIAPDYFRFRAVWFAIQMVVFVAAAIGIAVWIGGRIGAYAIAATALVFAAPSVIYAFQQGNFQTTAVSLGLAGFLLLSRSRLAAGALLLTFTAAAKIFPGILVVWLAVRRQWRALAWCAGCGVLLVAVALAVFGTRPFEMFLTHELPEISDGRAFPHAERRTHTTVNQSVYGLTVRLRHLGVESLDTRRGLAIASVYGLLVLAFAAWVAWRMRVDLDDSDGRIRLAMTALALITLASFRSPFVGGSYGTVSTFWLMALLAARAVACLRADRHHDRAVRHRAAVCHRAERLGSGADRAGSAGTSGGARARSLGARALMTAVVV